MGEEEKVEGCWGRALRFIRGLVGAAAVLEVEQSWGPKQHQAFLLLSGERKNKCPGLGGGGQWAHESNRQRITITRPRPPEESALFGWPEFVDVAAQRQPLRVRLWCFARECDHYVQDFEVPTVV